MSNRVPRQHTAFHDTLTQYHNCRTATDSGSRAGGFYANLSDSVSSMTGKVRVCASDLIADVELAANRALRDFPAERKVFQRIFLEQDTAFEKVFAKHLGQEPYDVLFQEIVTRVGQEFIDRDIFPIRKYTQIVDVR